ncbi:MAG: type II toxin-antitoxin system VapC family toxin [Clostridia bacterium]|nr:type II toxin-antitoxin system VapC family toxin [Clostridia bacterium]
MICSRIVDETHLVEKKNKYLVDTNILIYLYGDSRLVTETPKLKGLSAKFNQALNIGCDVYIPAIVISEFINKYHRLEWNNIKKRIGRKNYDYKRDYRNSTDFIKNNKFIMETLKTTILSRCKMIEDKFTVDNKDILFNVNEGQDFNDVLIINIANKNGLYLISADMDSQKIVIK